MYVVVIVDETFLEGDPDAIGPFEDEVDAQGYVRVTAKDRAKDYSLDYERDNPRYAAYAVEVTSP